MHNSPINIPACTSLIFLLIGFSLVAYYLSYAICNALYINLVYQIIFAMVFLMCTKRVR